MLLPKGDTRENGRTEALPNSRQPETDLSEHIPMTSNGIARRPHPRIAVDQGETMGYPLTLMGNKFADVVDVTEIGGDSLLATVAFEPIHWQMSRRLQNGQPVRLPNPQVLDVYFGLTFLYSLEGFPEHGEVRFSRYNFLQMLGWVSNGRYPNGTKLVKPSGRHYQQLHDALELLLKTSYSWRGENHTGKGYNILDSYELKEDKTGPRALGEELPKTSKAVFTRTFASRFEEGSSSVSVDLDLYLSLPPNTPRLLYRVLTWMRYRGINRLTLEELFNRLGGTTRQYVKSYAERVLGDAHDSLMLRGIIRSAPVYEKVNGAWYITYDFGDPVALFAEEEELIRQAVAFGVAMPVARELAVAHRDRFREVIAAVTSGRLRAKKNVAGMIVTYTRRPDYAIPRASINQTLQTMLPAQPTLPIATIEEEYAAWIAQEQERRLRARSDLDIASMRQEIIRSCTDKGLPAPEDWYVDGLLRVRLNKELDLPSLEWYKERREAGAIQPPNHISS